MLIPKNAILCLWGYGIIVKQSWWDTKKFKLSIGIALTAAKL